MNNDNPIDLSKKAPILNNRVVVSFSNKPIKIGLTIEMNSTTLALRKGDASGFQIQVQDLSLTGATDIRVAIYSEPTDTVKVFTKNGLSFSGDIVTVPITQGEADSFTPGNYIGEVAVFQTIWKHSKFYVSIENIGVSHS